MSHSPPPAAERRSWRWIALATVVLAAAAVWASVRPSADADWAADHARLATATFDGTAARVSNVRRFEHCPDSGEPIERWETRVLDLEHLDSLWLVLSPFERDWRGPAHPFLSFGFGDTTFVSITVEARRQRGEDYSIWRGLLKQFELIYVVADERDVVTLRAACRDDDVYVYPIATTPERARRLFVSMLTRANELAGRPEFYHTLWKSCATTMLAHANEVAEKRIPGGWRVMLPGYSDEIARSQGLIAVEGSMQELRERFLVNDRVKRALHEDRGASFRSVPAAP